MSQSVRPTPIRESFQNYMSKFGMKIVFETTNTLPLMSKTQLETVGRDLRRGPSSSLKLIIIFFSGHGEVREGS